MLSTYALNQKQHIAELIATGYRTEAITACLALAEYFDMQEANSDMAGESADSMRASHQAQAMRDRARELAGEATPNE